MSKVRWWELSRAAQNRLQWILFYYDRQDLSTLEGRSHRPRKVRRPTWTSALVERVLALRREYPPWGKDKLVVLLRREDRMVSASMVGRILADLQRRGVLHEPPRSAVLLRAHR